MPFTRIQKPEKRNLSNENNNNEQIENHEAIVEQVFNSAISDWLSGGMNNNNNNQQFDQRDSEPKSDDHYAKTMKAAEREVKEKNEAKEDGQLLENSLGSIALSCEILLASYERQIQQEPMSRRGKKSAPRRGKKPILIPEEELEEVGNELIKMLKDKKSFQWNKEEIESILDKITAWLDRYGGNNDEVDEIRLEIKRCKWALLGWEKWKNKLLEGANVISLYALNGWMEEIEAEAQDRAEINKFKELSWRDRREKERSLRRGTFANFINLISHCGREFVERRDMYIIKNKVKEDEPHSALERRRMVQDIKEQIDVFSREYLPILKEYRQDEKCKELINLLRAEIEFLEEQSDD